MGALNGEKYGGSRDETHVKLREAEMEPYAELEGAKIEPHAN